jgi:methanogenic corrinoid protein MtbC1
MVNLHDISVCVQSGDAGQTSNLTALALQENYSPQSILKEGLAAGMIEMERKFRKNEILDSEVLVAERALKTGLRLLMPALNALNGPSRGRVITGTLEGEIRETEKNLAAVLMQSRGLVVIDLGLNVSSARFVEAALEERAQLIVCSTGLTIFLPQMKSLVQAAAQGDIRDETKILLSGGPVTEWFCQSIGADMYAPDPVTAAEIAAAYCESLKQKKAPSGPHPGTTV